MPTFMRTISFKAKKPARSKSINLGKIRWCGTIF